MSKGITYRGPDHQEIDRALRAIPNPAPFSATEHWWLEELLRGYPHLSESARFTSHSQEPLAGSQEQGRCSWEVSPHS